MTQLPLFVAMALIGTALTLGFGLRNAPHLNASLGFVVGLAATVLTALAILVVGVPLTELSLGLGMLPIVALAVRAAVKRGVGKRELAIAATWLVGFAVVAAPLCRHNLAIMTFDSHKYVMIGHIIGHDGAILKETYVALAKVGVFQTVVHALHAFTLQDFLFAEPVVFGLSFAGAFLAAGAHAGRLFGVPPARVRITVGLVALALFTISMSVRHIVYIHTNFASGAYVFVYVTLFWFAEISEDATPLPLAFLGLAAFTFQRVEAPAFTLVLLAFTTLPSRLPREKLTPWILTLLAGTIVWYQALARYVPHGKFLTPSRCHLVSAALVAFALFWLFAMRGSLATFVRKHLSQIVAVALALAMVGAFATKFEHMLVSAEAWALNLTELPHWGYSWFFIVVMVFVSLRLPVPRFRQAYSHAIVATLFTVLLLAYGRVPYRFNVNDSANRMTMHILPLMFFYIGLKLLLASRPEPEPEA